MVLLIILNREKIKFELNYLSAKITELNFYIFSMFIVLEAIDGAGKGRQRTELINHYKQIEQSVGSCDFPDHDGFLYDKIIHPALHREIEIEPKTFMLSFMLDQMLWQPKIRSALRSPNNHFIADGYFTTTLVYQCYLGQVMDIEEAVDLAERLGIVKPDMNIYLDVDPKVALSRKQQEQGHEEGLDMYEGDLVKQNKIREGFLYLAEHKIFGDWEIIDGHGTIEEVKDQVIKLTDKHILA